MGLIVQRLAGSKQQSGAPIPGMRASALNYRIEVRKLSSSREAYRMYGPVPSVQFDLPATLSKRRPDLLTLIIVTRK